MTVSDLGGEWELMERPLDAGAEAAEAVAGADVDLAVSVPGDVNDALVRAGRLPEPLVGTNFRQFDWVKERSWWFRKRFTVPAGWDSAAAVELSLDGLDIHADIWLNGRHLGHHASSFYPFEQNVGPVLKYGEENVLLVRLTCGAEQTPENPEFPLLKGVPTEEQRGYPDRGFRKRIYLRKPACVWGWDWGPPLPTCGITGRCELRRMDKTEIRHVALHSELEGQDAVVYAVIEVEHTTLIESTWGNVTLEMTDEDGVVHRIVREGVFIPSGCGIVELELSLKNVRLWWPNGSGEQHRYRVSVSVEVDGDTVGYHEFRYGVRTVEMINEPGRFGFQVNGVPIFIKGGNWIPADSLYGRVTDAKLTRLVEEAATANFNCLRIWGGGRYEPEAFYDACDRLGILVWHDFMSACAPLPAHEPWFVREFMAEARYQVRRLYNRTCLLLWCGNNEVSSCYGWLWNDIEDDDPGWRLYHQLLPRMVHELAPHIPYWPSSPYGGERAGHGLVGDCHHWTVMSRDSRDWSDPAHWDGTDIPIFNSEYGYGGPCCLASTKQYLGSETPDLFSEEGREHTNTFYDIQRVNFSIGEHYEPPEGLSLDRYILLGGLCQGLNLGYSLEAQRANEQTWGGIFWMYNDTWGENGWTVIDYYMRRKVSYYNVKRCLAHRHLLIRRGGRAFGGLEHEVLLIALNDTAETLVTNVRFGYSGWDGGEQTLEDVSIEVPARSKKTVARCPVPDAAALEQGTVVAYAGADSGLRSAWWWRGPYRQNPPPPTTVTVEGVERDADESIVTLRAAGFAHAVHFVLDDDARPEDQYFDLLPGEVIRLRVPASAGQRTEDVKLWWHNM